MALCRCLHGHLPGGDKSSSVRLTTQFALSLLGGGSIMKILGDSPQILPAILQLSSLADPRCLSLD